MSSLSSREIRELAPGDYYTAYHAPRYSHVLRLAGEFWRSRVEDARTDVEPLALDIGRSLLTTLLARRLGARVDTLGFEPDSPTETGRHWQVDLNSAQHEHGWRRDLPGYDLIVMAEVIEHLHTAPLLVLRFIRSLLRPGGVLILQTPNAASWNKRILLLLGRQPYDPISLNPATPGHFREYTRDELRGLAAQADLRIVRCEMTSYFDYRYRFSRTSGLNRPTPGSAWANVLAACLPPSLRRGITLTMVRDS